MQTQTCNAQWYSGPERQHTCGRTLSRRDLPPQLMLTSRDHGRPIGRRPRRRRRRHRRARRRGHPVSAVGSADGTRTARCHCSVSSVRIHTCTVPLLCEQWSPLHLPAPRSKSSGTHLPSEPRTPACRQAGQFRARHRRGRHARDMPTDGRVDGLRQAAHRRGGRPPRQFAAGCEITLSKSACRPAPGGVSCARRGWSGGTHRPPVRCAPCHNGGRRGACRGSGPAHRR